MLDLVGNPNCWFCHAQAHLVDASWMATLLGDSLSSCPSCMMLKYRGQLFKINDVVS